MTSIYAKLLAALDQQFIFPNRVSSSVSKLDAYFDYRTQENVVILEYRVKIHGDQDDDDDRYDHWPHHRNDPQNVRDEHRQNEMMEEMQRDHRDGNYMADINALLEANPYSRTSCFDACFF
jgi:hypothetical protein